jgi:cytochrome c-type biogenesis protein CcmE
VVGRPAASEDQAMSTPSTTNTTSAAGAAPGGRRVRLRLAVVIATVLAGITVLAVSGLGESLVYYRTPTELVRDPGLVDQPVRVGGMVAPESLRERDGASWFTLTDGVTDLPVRYTGPAVATLQTGQNALVEGRLDADGIFHGEQVMVKHSDTYQGPGAAGNPTPEGGRR